MVDGDRRNEETLQNESPANVFGAELADTTTLSTPGIAPTWATIYEQYLALNTEGSCGRSGACHAAEMANAASSYAWLQQRGYIAGPRSAIASTSNSCLRWFGGNMPPGGKPNPRAAHDIDAWVAAGAPND